jgi:hypothetical protein
MDAGIDGESEVFPLGWYADVAVNLDDAFAIVATWREPTSRLMEPNRRSA